jgi:hypothetical protein
MKFKKGTESSTNQGKKMCYSETTDVGIENNRPTARDLERKHRDDRKQDVYGLEGLILKSYQSQGATLP